MKMNGNTILITGGGSGIGRGLAEAFHRRGNQVLVTGRRLERLKTLCAANPGMIAVELDVRDPDAIRRVTAQILADYPALNVLVNNAGIMALAPIAETDDASFDRLIAVNLKGTFNTLREAANRLRSGGRIVNFSSSVVGLLQPTYGVYAATKAAVEAMTSILAKELRGRAITVNAVAPGPTATDLFLKGKPQAMVDHLAKLAPLERLGQPEDIAATVAMLVGPDGAWINGQTLRANGGII